MVEHDVDSDEGKLDRYHGSKQESAGTAIRGKKIWMRQSPYDAKD
jgi:hypothetical protein